MLAALRLLRLAGNARVREGKEHFRFINDHDSIGTDLPLISQEPFAI
jgi:hypothetical protein